MVKVQCVNRFNDVTQPAEKMQRSPGDVWEVTEERAKHLVNEGMVNILSEKSNTVKTAENKVTDK